MKQLADKEKVKKSELDIFSNYAECVFLLFSVCFQVLYTSIQRTPLSRTLLRIPLDKCSMI